jgi:hypothetical protein
MGKDRDHAVKTCARWEGNGRRGNTVLKKNTLKECFTSDRHGGGGEEVPAKLSRHVKRRKKI